MYHAAYLADTQAERYVLCQSEASWMSGEGDGRGVVTRVAQAGQCWASVRLEPVKGGGDGT